ncbi:NAD(P)-dependent oxidoreductase [Roseibium sp.]|uniref:NAD(P)-dependent oxidoreductase n=1 Tax=Roseibium sp. TaxID=1936156 RepID=UPI003BAB086F
MKPSLILDQHFRKLEELFSASTFEALRDLCEVHGGQNWPMPNTRIDELLPKAEFYVAAQPVLSASGVARAQNLRATIEVSGAFRTGLDYEACFSRGIEVLSCSPGFRTSVAEMTLAMILAGGRGLVAEHEAFRHGAERWLDDRESTDFSLYGQTIGFIGYGQISRETHRLLAPFAPNVLAHDPYLAGETENVTLCDLETLVARCRVVVVAAVPSEDTRGLLSAKLIERLRPGALVVLISRAWCADFNALVKAAESGRITVATDVFPEEPLMANDPLRQARNVILSPHRAAAVPEGRQLIGDMILHDVTAILDGRPERQLKAADPDLVQGLVSAQNNIGVLPNTS